MWKIIRWTWNIVFGLAIITEAIRFDYHHVRRLGTNFFRRSPEKWNLSQPEQKALARFFLWATIALSGNALISLLKWILEISAGQ